MDALAKFWASASKMLWQRMTVRVNGQPHFFLELVSTILLHCVYVYLCFEIIFILRHTQKLKPHTVQFRKAIQGKYSKDSLCTSITRIRHEYTKYDINSSEGYRRPMAHTISKLSKRSMNECSRDIEWLQTGEIFKPILQDQRTRLVAEKLSSISPAQFVKLDKERQIRERQVKGCMQSLTTLFDKVVKKKFPETNLREQIETAKEETACSQVSDQVMKYLESENVTDSLINVLNDIVEDSENPLPVKGDLTTLIYDIGNFKDKSSMIFDTKCELVPSTTSYSSITKTDVS